MFFRNAKKNLELHRARHEQNKAAASHASLELKSALTDTVASPPGIAGFFLAGLLMGGAGRARKIPRKAISAWRFMALLGGLGHKLYNSEADSGDNSEMEGTAPKNPEETSFTWRRQNR